MYNALMYSNSLALFLFCQGSFSYPLLFLVSLVGSARLEKERPFEADFNNALGS